MVRGLVHGLVHGLDRVRVLHDPKFTPSRVVLVVVDVSGQQRQGRGELGGRWGERARGWSGWREKRREDGVGVPSLILQ